MKAWEKHRVARAQQKLQIAVGLLYEVRDDVLSFNSTSITADEKLALRKAILTFDDLSCEMSKAVRKAVDEEHRKELTEEEK